MGFVTMKTVSLSIIVYLLHNALFMSIVCRYITDAITRTPFPLLWVDLHHTTSCMKQENLTYYVVFLYSIILCER